MTLANKITLWRILLVPAILASLIYYRPEREYLRFVALGAYLIAILSDALDGYVARKQGQESQLGTLLDPIADKLLILSTLIACSTIPSLPEDLRIPAWFNLLVITRDALLVGGAFVLYLMTGCWSVQPSTLGKWTTFLQMLVVPVVLLGLPIKDPLLFVSATLTLCSMTHYVRVGIRVLE